MNTVQYIVYQLMIGLVGVACLSLLNVPLALAAPNDGIRSMKLGAVEIISFQDFPTGMNRSTFTGVEPATIDALWPKSKTGALEKAPASMNAFAIKTPTQIILVDTGLGSFSERVGNLAGLLGKAKISPESVNAVLLTHMHGDHIGGLLDKDGKPVFPNATIYLSSPEKAFWSDDAAMNAAPEARKPNFELARKSLAAYGDKVHTFEFGAEPVQGVTALNAVGHTPGHTAYLLNSGTQKVLFCGDLVHAAAVQMPNPAICASYDMDMPQAVKTRREIMKKAASERLMVAGAHLPFPATGRIEALGNGFIYKPWQQ